MIKTYFSDKKQTVYNILVDLTQIGYELKSLHFRIKALNFSETFRNNILFKINNLNDKANILINKLPKGISPYLNIGFEYDTNDGLTLTLDHVVKYIGLTPEEVINE